MTFGTDIYGAQKLYPYDFGDPPTFRKSASRCLDNYWMNINFPFRINSNNSSYSLTPHRQVKIAIVEMLVLTKYLHNS